MAPLFFFKNYILRRTLMKQSRTVITFSQFQDIEPLVTKTLTDRHLNYGVWHSHGLTTLLVDAKLNKSDFDPVAAEYIQLLYHEDTCIAEERYLKQDDPIDIVECMTHNLSGLID